VWSVAKWKEEFKVVTCVTVFSLNHQTLTIMNETLEAVTERICQNCYTVCTFASCWHVGFWKWLIPYSPPPPFPVVQDAACIRSTAISAFVTDWNNYLTSNIPFAWKFVSQDFYLVSWGQTVARWAKCRDSHRTDHTQYPLFPGTPSPGRRRLWPIFRQMSFQGHCDNLFLITFVSSSVFFDDA